MGGREGGKAKARVGEEGEGDGGGRRRRTVHLNPQLDEVLRRMWDTNRR